MGDVSEIKISNAVLRGRFGVKESFFWIVK